MSLLLKIIKKDEVGLGERSLETRMRHNGGAGQRDESEAASEDLETEGLDS